MIEFALLAALHAPMQAAADGPAHEILNVTVLSAPRTRFPGSGYIFWHAYIEGRTETGEALHAFLPLFSGNEAIPLAGSICNFTVHLSSMNGRTVVADDPEFLAYPPYEDTLGSGLIIDRFDCRLVGGPDVEA